MGSLGGGVQDPHIGSIEDMQMVNKHGGDIRL